jgi:hypothetical protein
MVFVASCAPPCMQQLALTVLVDSKDCKKSIATLKGLSTDFKKSCESGLANAAGGAGGCGGSGGAGGCGG